MFVAGGGVLWTPVLVKGTKIKTPDRFARRGSTAGEAVAWLASRQPPIKLTEIDEKNLFNPVRIDVTEALNQKLEDMSSGSSSPTVDLLYDCRFLVRFDVTKMPSWVISELQNQARISIWPQTRWFWPKVVLGDESLVLHSDVAEHGEFFAFLQISGSDGGNKYWKRAERVVASDWIHVEWVRPLSRI